MSEVKTLDAPKTGRGEDAPRERPILFSAPMVRAILEGRKTQTRRILKVQPAVKPMPANGRIDVRLAALAPEIRCPYGQPGDRLWVRETWSNDGCACYEMCGCPAYWYRADFPNLSKDDSPKWKPSIHMPRRASRLTLEVTGVRVERLKDISEENAIREGAAWQDFGRQCGHFGGWQDVGDCQSEYHPRRNGWTMEPPAPNPDYCHGTARMAFANLINKINGPETWDANPWVWVVEFRPLDMNSQRTAVRKA